MSLRRYATTHLETIDAWGRNKSAAGYVYRPSTVEGILELLQFARESRSRIVLRGAGRSYGDASLGAEQIILDISRLNRILEWNPVSGRIVCEAGV
ncbi:MAG: FAD-binding oxidoreductase, partial [Armatimonadaceae bacterium]